MAEVAGLVFGAIALVSLVSTCKHALEAIDHARSKDHDFQILHQRLQMQKDRFRRWGKSLRLDKRDICACCPLISTEADARIAGTLGAIVNLFDQGQEIAQRHDKRKSTTAVENPFRMRKGSHAIPGRWVLHDRAKFQDLVDQTKKLIDDLEMILKSVNYKHLRRWKRDTCHLLRLNKMLNIKAASTTASAREKTRDDLRHFKEVN